MKYTGGGGGEGVEASAHGKPWCPGSLRARPRCASARAEASLGEGGAIIPPMHRECLWVTANGGAECKPAECTPAKCTPAWVTANMGDCAEWQRETAECRPTSTRARVRVVDTAHGDGAGAGLVDPADLLRHERRQHHPLAVVVDAAVTAGAPRRG
jgi:hypothetical protein